MYDYRDFLEFLKDSLKYILTFIVILIIVIYVISLQQVLGTSMKPNLNNNDIVLLSKLSYKIHDVKRNDIISFTHTDSKYLVKRVIGLPGEKVQIKNNKLYINDEIVEENFISKDIHMNDFDLIDIGYEKIPEHMYFVLGDNRNESTDSRSKTVGLINEDKILGKVFIRIWPLNKFKIIK